MTIIFDSLRMQVAADAMREAGPNATFDRLRYAIHEIGNKFYFDADTRLNPERIEKPFTPISGANGDDLIILNDNGYVKDLLGDPNVGRYFEVEFKKMHERFRKEYTGTYLFDLAHIAAHALGIGHTPREEGLTILAENGLFNTDSNNHLLCNTFLKHPDLRPFIQTIKSFGFDMDVFYKEVSSMLVNFGMNGNYFDKKYLHNNETIITSGTPSPAQILTNEIYEVAAASKIVANKFEVSKRIPLSTFELTQLPSQPAKLLTLNDNERDTVYAIVYPNDSHPDKNRQARSEHKNIINYVDNIREKVEDFIAR